MSIETKLARVMSELDDLDERVVLVQLVDTTLIERSEGGWWSITTKYEGDVYRTRQWLSRDELENEIRSLLKCQEQLLSL